MQSATGMNTFVPFGDPETQDVTRWSPDFDHTKPRAVFARIARALDDQRVWKQAIEGRQILTAMVRVFHRDMNDTLSAKAGTLATRTSVGYEHHPAVHMWVGHSLALLDYTKAMLGESLMRGVQASPDTVNGFADLGREILVLPQALDYLPSWWGGAIHFTHRANLCAKNRNHYGSLFPDVMDTDMGFAEVPYYWPSQHGWTPKLPPKPSPYTQAIQKTHDQLLRELVQAFGDRGNVLLADQGSLYNGALTKSLRHAQNYQYGPLPVPTKPKEKP